MRVTIDLSEHDLAVIAAYVGLVNPPDRVQAADYVRAAVRSCLDQDVCFLRAKTVRGRICARLKGDSPERYRSSSR